MPAELAREWERRFGVRFSIMFGTTECSPIISFTRLDDPPEIRTGTLGTPLPHTEVKIADVVNGQPVPVGTVGELCARGYLVMHGYFDDPAATAAVDRRRRLVPHRRPGLDGRGRAASASRAGSRT